MGYNFDPGFIQHLSSFVLNIEQLYGLLGRYKNFNQRKTQFRMYYPKIVALLNNYVGFYLGCILWAVYIKQFEGEDILNNLCYGGEYSEEETLSEVDFVKNYMEQLKKDAKYYANQNYTIDTTFVKIVDVYREFLKINEGFVKTKTTNDLKIPSDLKTPSGEDMNLISQKIKSVCESGKLSELLTLADKVL